MTHAIELNDAELDLVHGAGAKEQQKDENGFKASPTRLTAGPKVEDTKSWIGPWPMKGFGTGSAQGESHI